MTWQLLGYAPPVPPDTSGIVSLNLVLPNGSVQFMQVSNVDIIGAQYLGPTPPAPGPVSCQPIMAASLHIKRRTL
ncbi:hypothetical protein ACFQ3J_19650 [Paenibacillus provencensis]|uniref:Uncharacterized protein n=1 Tax=Paenibacillus provencensis TaxID=441151 RepID=A0ABW3Q1B5_9BACL|nr:hypothetical protein [Paenibacillus sp. MER 78]MCM3129339.1 hypothetical protein [Paenibacillus sp. MER 78]